MSRFANAIRAYLHIGHTVVVDNFFGSASHAIYFHLRIIFLKHLPSTLGISFMLVTDIDSQEALRQLDSIEFGL